MKRNFAITLCFLWLSSALCVQGNAQEITVLKSAKGYVFLLNRGHVHLTVEFIGAKLTPMDSEKIFFDLDGKVIQIQTVEKKEFTEASKKQSLSELETLEKHREWEQRFLNELLKAQLKFTSEQKSGTEAREHLIWSFPMPEGISQDVKEQVFLTSVIGENVLVLNYSVMKGDTKAAAIAYLTQSLNSLKTSDKAISVQSVQESLRKN